VQRLAMASLGLVANTKIKLGYMLYLACLTVAKGRTHEGLSNLKNLGCVGTLFTFRCIVFLIFNL